MSEEHRLIQSVLESQDDVRAADAMILKYLPFIKAETSRFSKRYMDQSEDAVSIAMMAFYEAILSYKKHKGAFLSFASLTIKSRLIDYYRSESRHFDQVSLDVPLDDHDSDTLLDQIAGDEDSKSLVRVEATEHEIKEFTQELARFGLSLEDLTQSSPKQERTLAMCHDVIRYAYHNPELLDDVMRTKKLPVSIFVEHTSINKKTLERHRRYILGMLLVLTNGFDLMREHLKKVIRKDCDQHEISRDGNLS